MLLSFLQLTVDEKPTVNVLSKTIQLFRDTVCLSKIFIIYGIFCFPDQSNDTISFLASFLYVGMVTELHYKLWKRVQEEQERILTVYISKLYISITNFVKLSKRDKKDWTKYLVSRTFCLVKK